jgi:DNA-binding CsgD family transcriptional regulator
MNESRHEHGREGAEEPENAALPEGDVRAVVRLLADVAVLDGDHRAKKRALMEGLRELVDADGWLWSMTRVDIPGNTPMSIGLMHGGLTNRQVTGWVEASQRVACPPPEDAPLTEELKRGKHFTRTRDQVVPDAAWYAHPSVRRYRLRLGLDHFLYSIYPLDEPGVISAIGLFRRRGRPPFTARDRKLAHILLGEVDWLHYAELPGDRGRQVPELTPRQRVVLVLLIDARDKDEIAHLLHISPHTAKDHIKAVYRHFRVGTQLELIRRLKCGDSGDLPR